MSNSCDCPNPPGGTVICSDDQLAVCGYVNGRIVSGCFDPPEHVSKLQPQHVNIRVANWVLSVVTGEHRPSGQRITSQDVGILQSGKFTSLKGDSVSFSLPRDFELSVFYTSA